MKYIKAFESHSDDTEFLKKYGQSYPMGDVKEGDNILYNGTKYKVVMASDIVLKIMNDKSTRPLLINKSMFEKDVAIIK